jgi:hypothetical protein
MSWASVAAAVALWERGLSQERDALAAAQVCVRRASFVWLLIFWFHFTGFIMREDVGGISDGERRRVFLNDEKLFRPCCSRTRFDFNWIPKKLVSPQLQFHGYLWTKLNYEHFTHRKITTPYLIYNNVLNLKNCVRVLIYASNDHL